MVVVVVVVVCVCGWVGVGGWVGGWVWVGVGEWVGGWVGSDTNTFLI